MQWLLDILNVKNGSTLRLVMLWTFFIILGIWGSANIIAIIHHQPFIDLPENVMKLLLGIGATKVGQKWVESKTPPSDTQK